VIPVLGSSSPRRRELLGLLFENIETVKPEVDEKPLPGEKAADFSERVANDKMKSVLDMVTEKNDRLFITSDTDVVLQDRIFGKPLDRNDAFQMLKTLSGRKHTVLTSLCLCHYEGEKKIIETMVEKSTVFFHELDDNRINRYLDLIEFMDKAGAYAVQEHGAMIIERLEGSMSNVVGFPMRLFLKMILQMGLIHLL